MPAPEISILKEALTVEQFAETFSIGRTTAFKLFKTGQVKPVKIFGKTIVLRSEVERFAASLQEALR